MGSKRYAPSYGQRILQQHDARRKLLEAFGAVKSTVSAPLPFLGIEQGDIMFQGANGEKLRPPLKVIIGFSCDMRRAMEAGTASPGLRAQYMEHLKALEAWQKAGGVFTLN